MKPTHLIHKIVRTICLIFFPLIFIGCDEEVYDMDEPGNLLPKTVSEDLLLPRLEIDGKLFHAETMGN